jgi:hypothetical protein
MTITPKKDEKEDNSTELQAYNENISGRSSASLLKHCMVE